MKRIVALASIVTIGLAGCATGSDPAAVAARQCENFARLEGARLVGVDAVDAVSDGFKVKMQVEDGLSRRINAECLYSSAGNQARWAAPLPSGFVKI